MSDNLITEQEFEQYMSGFKKDTPKSIIDWCNESKARPLRGGGIDYVFKPASKYPARIYVFLHAEEFMQRNRRPQGCMDRRPFITRRMTREEVIECHFDFRMRYYQYENWQALIDSEIQTLGPDHDFIAQLEKYRNMFEKDLKGTYNPKQTTLQL